MTVLSNATGTGIVQLVQSRLGDKKQYASATDTGDGSSTIFKLPDMNIVSSSVTCTVAGVAKSETTHWTLDYSTGWFTFLSAPANEAAIIWIYQWRMFPDTDVKYAINAAIDYVGNEGGFYQVYYDDDASGDTTTVDFPLPPRTAKVIRVDFEDSSGTITKKDNWETYPTNSYTKTAHTSDYLATTAATTLTFSAATGTDGITAYDVLKDAASNELVQVTSIDSSTAVTVTRGYRSTTATTHASAATWTKWNDRILHFTTAPDTGTIHLTLQRRPAHLSSDSDTLEYTSGMPERALEPIVLYSCYHLINSRVAPRAFDDRAHQTQEGTLRADYIQDIAVNMKLQCDAIISKMRPRPHTGRVRGW